MRFSDQSYNLRIELNADEVQFNEREIETMETALDPLRGLVEKFPVSDLFIHVSRGDRSGQYHVKMSLRLQSRTLVASVKDDNWRGPFDRCVRVLAKRVEAFRSNLSNEDEHRRAAHGTVDAIIPTREPDFEALQVAARDRDYLAFRQGMYVYEDQIRKRAGRWIQRFPRAQADLGSSFDLSDIVEDVILNAFETFADRPRNVPFSVWLEEQIDSAIKSLLVHPDEEQEAISFAKTLQEMSKSGNLPTPKSSNPPKAPDSKRSQSEIDETVEESFPASDPPSWSGTRT